MTTKSKENLRKFPLLAKQTQPANGCNQETKNTNVRQPVGTCPTSLIMTALPRRDCLERTITRNCQTFSLEMNCSLLGMPFGFMPRLILATINNLALHNHSQYIEMGSTISDMLNLMRIPTDSHNKNLLLNQWYRLFRTLFIFEQTKGFIVEDRLRESKLLFSTAIGSLSETAEYSLTDGNLSFWDGMCRLDTDYFNMLLSHSSLMSLNALAALRSNTFEMDLYSWLTHRIYTLNFTDDKEVWLAHKTLQELFNYSPNTVNVTSFRSKVRKALRTISMIYPEVIKYVKEDSEGRGLVIRAGKPNRRLK
jgi:hypothetical protein